MRRIGFLLVGFLLCAPSGSGAEVTINFDDLPANSLPVPQLFPDDYSEYAAFSTEPGAQLIYFSQAGVVGTSAPNTITAAVDPNAFPYSSNLYVDFTRPANDLTFRVSSDNDAGEIAKILVWHSLSALADEVVVVGDGNLATPILIDLASYRDVTRVAIVEVEDEFGLSYDDFAFDADLTLVPEPTGWMILLAAALIWQGARGLSSAS